MGIQGLLPLLQPLIIPTSFAQLRGKCICVDGYMLLHKVIIRSPELAFATNPYQNVQKQWIKQATQLIDQLTQHNIDVVVVFDGMETHGKQVESTRRDAREQKYSSAWQMLQKFISAGTLNSTGPCNSTNHNASTVSKGGATSSSNNPSSKLEKSDKHNINIETMSREQKNKYKRDIESKFAGCIDVNFHMACELIAELGAQFHQRFSCYQFDQDGQGQTQNSQPSQDPTTSPLTPSIPPSTSHPRYNPSIGSVDWLISPFEADSQMVNLVKSNICYLALADDSDLIALGCPRVLTKADFYQKNAGDMIVLDDIFSKPNSPFYNMNLYQLQACAIISGCDYSSGIFGVGMKTAIQMAAQNKCICNILQRPIKVGPNSRSSSTTTKIRNADEERDWFFDKQNGASETTNSAKTSAGQGGADPIYQEDDDDGDDWDRDCWFGSHSTVMNNSDCSSKNLCSEYTALTGSDLAPPMHMIEAFNLRQKKEEMFFAFLMFNYQYVYQIHFLSAPPEDYIASSTTHPHLLPEALQQRQHQRSARLPTTSLSESHYSLNNSPTTTLAASRSSTRSQSILPQHNPVKHYIYLTMTHLNPLPKLLLLSHHLPSPQRPISPSLSSSFSSPPQPFSPHPIPTPTNVSPVLHVAFSEIFTKLSTSTKLLPFETLSRLYTYHQSILELYHHYIKLTYEMQVACLYNKVIGFLLGGKSDSPTTIRSNQPPPSFTTDLHILSRTHSTPTPLQQITTSNISTFPLLSPIPNLSNLITQFVHVSQTRKDSNPIKTAGQGEPESIYESDLQIHNTQINSIVPSRSTTSQANSYRIHPIASLFSKFVAIIQEQYLPPLDPHVDPVQSNSSLQPPHGSKSSPTSRNSPPGSDFDDDPPLIADDGDQQAGQPQSLTTPVKQVKGGKPSKGTSSSINNPTTPATTPPQITPHPASQYKIDLSLLPSKETLFSSFLSLHYHTLGDQLFSYDILLRLWPYLFTKSFNLASNGAENAAPITSLLTASHQSTQSTLWGQFSSDFFYFLNVSTHQPTSPSTPATTAPHPIPQPHTPRLDAFTPPLTPSNPFPRLSPSFFTTSILELPHPSEQLQFSQFSYLFFRREDFLSHLIPYVGDLVSAICYNCSKRHALMQQTLTSNVSNAAGFTTNIRSTTDLNHTSSPTLDTQFEPFSSQPTSTFASSNTQSQSTMQSDYSSDCNPLDNGIRHGYHEKSMSDAAREFVLPFQLKCAHRPTPTSFEGENWPSFQSTISESDPNITKNHTVLFPFRTNTAIHQTNSNSRNGDVSDNDSSNDESRVEFDPFLTQIHISSTPHPSSLPDHHRPDPAQVRAASDSSTSTLPMTDLLPSNPITETIQHSPQSRTSMSDESPNSSSPSTLFNDFFNHIDDHDDDDNDDNDDNDGDEEVLKTRHQHSQFDSQIEFDTTDADLQAFPQETTLYDNSTHDNGTHVGNLSPSRSQTDADVFESDSCEFHQPLSVRRSNTLLGPGESSTTGEAITTRQKKSDLPTLSSLEDSLTILSPLIGLIHTQRHQYQSLLGMVSLYNVKNYLEQHKIVSKRIESNEAVTCKGYYLSESLRLKNQNILQVQPFALPVEDHSTVSIYNQPPLLPPTSSSSPPLPTPSTPTRSGLNPGCDQATALGSNLTLPVTPHQQAKPPNGPLKPSFAPLGISSIDEAHGWVPSKAALLQKAKVAKEAKKNEELNSRDLLGTEMELMANKEQSTMSDHRDSSNTNITVPPPHQLITYLSKPSSFTTPQHASLLSRHNSDQNETNAKPKEQHTKSSCVLCHDSQYIFSAKLSLSLKYLPLHGPPSISSILHLAEIDAKKDRNGSPNTPLQCLSRSASHTFNSLTTDIIPEDQQKEKSIQSDTTSYLPPPDLNTYLSTHFIALPIPIDHFLQQYSLQLTKLPCKCLILRYFSALNDPRLLSAIQSQLNRKSSVFVNGNNRRVALASPLPTPNPSKLQTPLTSSGPTFVTPGLTRNISTPVQNRCKSLFFQTPSEPGQSASKPTSSPFDIFTDDDTPKRTPGFKQAKATTKQPRVSPFFSTKKSTITNGDHVVIIDDPHGRNGATRSSVDISTPNVLNRPGNSPLAPFSNQPPHLSLIFATLSISDDAKHHSCISLPISKNSQISEPLLLLLHSPFVSLPTSYIYSTLYRIFNPKALNSALSHLPFTSSPHTLLHKTRSSPYFLWTYGGYLNEQMSTQTHPLLALSISFFNWYCYLFNIINPHFITQSEHLKQSKHPSTSRIPHVASQLSQISSTASPSKPFSANRFKSNGRFQKGTDKGSGGTSDLTQDPFLSQIAAHQNIGELNALGPNQFAAFRNKALSLIALNQTITHTSPFSAPQLSTNTSHSSRDPTKTPLSTPLLKRPPANAQPISAIQIKVQSSSKFFSNSKTASAGAISTDVENPTSTSPSTPKTATSLSRVTTLNASSDDTIKPDQLTNASKPLLGPDTNKKRTVLTPNPFSQFRNKASAGFSTAKNSTTPQTGQKFNQPSKDTAGDLSPASLHNFNADVDELLSSDSEETSLEATKAQSHFPMKSPLGDVQDPPQIPPQDSTHSTAHVHEDGNRTTQPPNCAPPAPIKPRLTPNLFTHYAKSIASLHVSQHQPQNDPGTAPAHSATSLPFSHSNQISMPPQTTPFHQRFQAATRMLNRLHPHNPSSQHQSDSYITTTQPPTSPLNFNVNDPGITQNTTIPEVIQVQSEFEQNTTTSTNDSSTAMPSFSSTITTNTSSPVPISESSRHSSVEQPSKTQSRLVPLNVIELLDSNSRSQDGSRRFQAHKPRSRKVSNAIQNTRGVFQFDNFRKVNGGSTLKPRQPPNANHHTTTPRPFAAPQPTFINTSRDQHKVSTFEASSAHLATAHPPQHLHTPQTRRFHTLETPDNSLTKRTRTSTTPIGDDNSTSELVQLGVESGNNNNINTNTTL